MKWKGREQSRNVEDRRRGGTTGKVAAGGGIIAVIFFIFQFLSSGGDTTQLIEQAPQIIEMFNSQSVENNLDKELTAAEEKQLEFVSVILNDTEDVWHQIFKENGMSYQEPKFVLFRGSVQSSCGGASTASGPFYCPADQKIYMDLDFFDQLQKQFNTTVGEFAIAYVIAHEVGHHVQTLLGTSSKVRQLQQKSSERNANKLSVALELQADFYAGVWANRVQKMKNILEEGDIQDALNAAHTVGDDNIQRTVQGQVVPDSFTHGSSDQRMYWFSKGFKTGDIKQGDTFSELNL